MLPDPQGADRPVVVLRLRGRTQVGATLVEVLSVYADELARAGGRLYLSGVSDHANSQLVASGKIRLDGPVTVERASSVVGSSTGRAVEAAEEWLVSRPEEAGGED